MSTILDTLSLLPNQNTPLGVWAYFLLALLVAVEGPIATLLGGAAASDGLMKPFFVFLSAVSGNLMADTLWYLVGYLGKTDWVFHFGKRLGLKPELIEHLKQQMISHAAKVLFLAKLTVSFVIPSLITAGLLRIPWKRWFPSFIIAESLWSGSLVLIGYYATEAIKRVEQSVEYAVLGLSLMFVAAAFLAGRRLIKQWDTDQTGKL